MGYHIINFANNKLKHDYAETYDELAYFECINTNSLIYQAEEHWIPVIVGESEKYKNFAQGWFRAGIQAQEIFRQKATEFGFALEEVNQSPESFKSYTLNANSLTIKRGDFLVRNRGHIEIDVKCRGFSIEDGESELNFDFKCEDVVKHLNMISITKTPILIAVYENKNDSPVDSNVYFFDIRMLHSNKAIKKINRLWGDNYRVPLSLTHKGYEFIDITYNDLIPTSKKKSYSVKEKRIIVINAYRKWSEDDDNKLELLFREGKSINELSKHFGRNNGSIRSRIKKLELNLKYDK